MEPNPYDLPDHNPLPKLGRRWPRDSYALLVGLALTLFGSIYFAWAIHYFFSSGEWFYGTNRATGLVPALLISLACVVIGLLTALIAELRWLFLDR